MAKQADDGECCVISAWMLRETICPSFSGLTSGEPVNLMWCSLAFMKILMKRHKGNQAL